MTVWMDTVDVDCIAVRDGDGHQNHRYNSHFSMFQVSALRVTQASTWTPTPF